MDSLRSAMEGKTKTQLFSEVKNSIVILCGEVTPETRIRLCATRIVQAARNVKAKNKAKPATVGDLAMDDAETPFNDIPAKPDYSNISVNIYGSYKDCNVMTVWEKAGLDCKAAQFKVTDEVPVALSDYSIICNAQGFAIDKIKKIITSTNRQTFVLCSKQSIRPLYKHLKIAKPLPIQWEMKESFLSDLLANEFNGKMELVIASDQRSDDCITNFLTRK